MNNYYEEIEHLIRKNETNKKARTYENNNEDLSTKWNIGRLLVEAQGRKYVQNMEIHLLKNGLKTLLINMAVDIVVGH